MEVEDDLLHKALDVGPLWAPDVDLPVMGEALGSLLGPEGGLVTQDQLDLNTLPKWKFTHIS